MFKPSVPVIPGITVSDTSSGPDGKPVYDGPRHYVRAFEADPAQWLRERAAPFLAHTDCLWIGNPCGRGRSDLTLPTRFDGKPATATSPFWCDDTYCGLDGNEEASLHNVALALRSFLATPALRHAFMYMGAPSMTFVLPKNGMTKSDALRRALAQWKTFLTWLPKSSAIFDNDGAAQPSYADATLLYAAIQSLNAAPAALDVGWGVEPNPPRVHLDSVFSQYRPDFMCGTPATWEAPTRMSIHTASANGYIPIVTITGGASNFPTPESRVEASVRWREIVKPLGGFVVAQGLSPEQYAQCLV